MSRRERVVETLRAGQARLIAAFEALDEATFGTHIWKRPGGGGGTARVLEGGSVLERAGINFSAVRGDAVPPTLVKTHPGSEGKPYFATGLSMVFHPRNPYAPAFHANYRYFEVGDEDDENDIWWFGGGADMTPNYPFAEDAIHFHRTLKAQCDRHSVGDYRTLKEACDTYFYLKHRREMRGVGGIFFDELSPVGAEAFETDFAFVEDGVRTIGDAYLPVLKKRKDTPYGEREREWQLLRRGRYVEFNLVYDRGTTFGLQTGGHIEAILMSMPPYAYWAFDYKPEVGSKEAEMLTFLQPRDWAGAGISGVLTSP